MKIKFKAIGLIFDADVDYTPPTPATYWGPGDHWEPGDPGEIEFLSLTCDGKDASFLIDSTAIYDIEDGAWGGIVAARRKQDDQFAAEAAADKAAPLY